MILCSMCKQPIDETGQYLSVTVHNNGRKKEYQICGSRCFVAYGTKAGLFEVAGSGPTQRFGRG